MLARPSPAGAQSPDLDKVLRNEQSVLDAMDQAIFEARRAEAAIRSADSARKAAEGRIEAASVEADRAHREADAARHRFQATVRLLAAAAPWQGAASSVLLGEAGDDLARRRALADRLAASQARGLVALTRAEQAAEAAEFRAGIERANAHAVAAAEADARERLASETGKRRALLDALDRDRTLALRHAAEVGLAERALVADVESRLSQPPVPVPFDRLKGKVHNPVAGARVAVPFGDQVHPVFRTVTPHPGLTLTTRAEVRNVRAVAFGRVAFTGPMRGFGTTVVVDHASGWYTVYAGLAWVDVAPGSIVREGTVLGRIERDPGEATASLYFEIRRGTDALDPADYLAPEP